MMCKVDQWLDEYGDSHRNPRNKALHWICVPIIVWCLLGLLWSLPFPGDIRTAHPAVNWGSPPLWSICVAPFVAAWIGQFIGHAIEGRRPSFFKDIQFLMIGPLWLLADAYRRLGIRC